MGQAQLSEREIDGAELRIKHVLPDRGDDQRRHGPGNHKDGSPELAEENALAVEQQRNRQADHEMKEDVRDCPGDIEKQDSPEIEFSEGQLITENARVVLKPDPIRPGAAQILETI